MLIGLTGKKGCGKSSIARILRDRHDFKVLSFAEPIKDMLEAMGVQRELMDDPCLKEQELELFGKSPRQLMQMLGTEFARDMIHPNIWVYLMEERITPHRHVVIDDVRFNNEAKMIDSYGGTVVEVIRGKHLLEDGHISEAGLAPEFIDTKIENISCQIRDLELEVERVVDEAIFSS